MKLKKKRILASLIALTLLVTNFFDYMPVFADELDNSMVDENMESNEDIELLSDDEEEQYTYTIYYFFDGVKDESKTETFQAPASAYPLTISIDNLTSYAGSSFELDASIGSEFTLTDNNQYINIMYNTTSNSTDITLNYIDSISGVIVGNEVLNLAYGTNITSIPTDDLNPPKGYQVGYIRESDGAKIIDYIDDLYDNPFIVTKGGPTQLNINVVQDTKKLLVMYDTPYELDIYSGDLGGFGNTSDSGWVILPTGTTIDEIPYYPGNAESGSPNNVANSLTLQSNPYRSDWVNMGYEVNYFSNGNDNYTFKPGDDKTISSFTLEDDMTISVHYDLPTSYTIHYLLNDGNGTYIEDVSLKEVVPDWCLSHSNSLASDKYKDIENYVLDDDRTNIECLTNGVLARNGANDCFLYYDKEEAQQKSFYIIDNYYDKDTIHTCPIPTDKPNMTIQDVLDNYENDLQDDCKVFISSIYDPNTYEYYYYYSYDQATGDEEWGGGMCLDANLSDTFDWDLSEYPCIVIVHPYKEEITNYEATYTVHYFIMGKDLGFQNGRPILYKEETSLQKDGTANVGEYLDTLAYLTLKEGDYPNISSYVLSGNSDMGTYFDEAKHYDINIYYDMIVANYNIYYYYDGVLDDSKTEFDYDIINKEINTYPDKLEDGYTLDKVVTEDIYGNFGNLPLILQDTTDLDVEKDAAIHVYYKTLDTSTGSAYFQYYIDDVWVGGTQTMVSIDDIISNAKLNEMFNKIPGYEDKSINDYEFVKVVESVEDPYTSTTKNLNIPYTLTANDFIVKSNYVLGPNIKTYLKTKAPATYDYEIHYFFDNNEDLSKKENGSATLDSIVNAKDYSSNVYDLDVVKTTKTSMTITNDSSKNILNIYYKTKETPVITKSFLVNTYLDGNLVEVQVGIAALGSIITDVSNYYSKPIENCELIGIENLPLEINPTESKNVVNVYYQTLELPQPKATTLLVNTFLDGELINTTSKACFAGDIITNVDSMYSYDANTQFLDRIESLPYGIKEDGNVINVYIVTKVGTVNYLYFYDGKLDENSIIAEKHKYGDIVSDYPTKDKDGFIFSRVEGLPCTINSNQQLVRVYYVSIERPLRLRIFLDDKLISTKELGNYKVGQIINNISLPSISNATLKNVDSLPYTILDTNENYIDAYYVTNKIPTPSPEPTPDPTPEPTPIPDPDPIIPEPEPIIPPPTPIIPTPDPIIPTPVIEVGYGSVTYRYYYDNVEDTSLSYTLSLKEGTQVTTYKSNLKDGYMLDSIDGLPTTITKDSNEIISIYYVKVPEAIKYEVFTHIYVDDIEVDNFSLGMYDVGDIIKELDLSNYDNYELVSSNLPFTVSDSNNNINIYYKTKPDRNITRTVVTVGVGVSIPLILFLLYFFKDKLILLLVPPKKRKEYLYGLWTSIEGASFIDKDGNEVKAEYNSDKETWIFFDNEGHLIDIFSNEYMLDKLNKKEITYDEFNEYLVTNGYSTVVDSTYKLQTNVNEETFEETELTQTNITNTLNLYKDNDDLTTINLNCYIKQDNISTITFIFGE